jgi:hypothetical protein
MFYIWFERTRLIKGQEDNNRIVRQPYMLNGVQKGFGLGSNNNFKLACRPIWRSYLALPLVCLLDIVTCPSC